MVLIAENCFRKGINLLSWSFALTAVLRIAGAADTHRRIIWALLMRELATRYGRNNLGFLWVMVEPLVFATAVSVLWSVLKPPYEHGVKIVPFVVTGYLPLILVRQSIGFAVNAVKSNQALLYHRQITPLHLFVARFTLEFLGISLAFVLMTLLLMALGFMSPPKDLLLVYAGWLILSALSFGLATVVGALGEIFEFVERFVQITTYILVPISGSFFMASWLPPQFRKWALLVPFVHCNEMIRGGFFGEFVKTYFDPVYPIAWAAGFIVLGLLLVQFVRGRIDVE